MLQRVNHTNINRQKWDACIKKSAGISFYAYSWYLDVVAPGWHGVVYKDYESVMVFAVTKKLGIPRVYQPFWMPDVGWFGKPVAISLEFTKIFTRFFDARFCLSVPELHKKLKSWQVDTRQYQTMALNKNAPLKYNKNMRRNIKKAQNHNLIIKKASPDRVIHLFKNEWHNRLKHIKETDFNRLTQACYQLDKRQLIKSIGVFSNDNELLAAGIFVKENNAVYYLKGATNHNGKKACAMHLLMHHAIEWAKKNTSHFNFGGSNEANLARFYKGFGGQDTTYTYWKYRKLPCFIKR